MGRNGIRHHPEKKAGVSAHLLDLTEDIESGDHAEKSRLPAGKKDVQCREAAALDDEREVPDDGLSLKGF